MQQLIFFAKLRSGQIDNPSLYHLNNDFFWRKVFVFFCLASASLVYTGTGRNLGFRMSRLAFETTILQRMGTGFGGRETEVRPLPDHHDGGWRDPVLPKTDLFAAVHRISTVIFSFVERYFGDENEGRKQNDLEGPAWCVGLSGGSAGGSLI